MPGIHKRSRVNRGCDVKVWLGLPSDRGGDEGFYAKEGAEVYDVMTRSKVSHRQADSRPTETSNCCRQTQNGRGGGPSEGRTWSVSASGPPNKAAARVCASSFCSLSALRAFAPRQRVCSSSAAREACENQVRFRFQPPFLPP